MSCRMMPIQYTIATVIVGKSCDLSHPNKPATPPDTSCGPEINHADVSDLEFHQVSHFYAFTKINNFE